MQTISNSARILQELVNVEAWHKPLVFDEPRGLHVALSFHDARYSGGDRSPVSFRVQLKRATLVIVCDANLSVPRGTKVREYPPMNQTVRTFDEAQSNSGSETEGEIGTEVSMSPDKLSAKANAKARVKDTDQVAAKVATERTHVLTQRVRMNYNEIGFEHHWNCEPIDAQALSGTAHNGHSPIIELKPKMEKHLRDLGVRVFLKCKADDLEITEIEVKQSILSRFSKDDAKKRLKMAKAVLKKKLAEAGLEIVDLDPKFQDVLLADLLAVPE